jgi:hypothetical protein
LLDGTPTCWPAARGRRSTRPASSALAEGQANSARESAEAASKQAYAAVDSARSARESVDLARTSLHRADQPRFELSGEEHEGGTLRVAARMVAGPPEVSVHGSWSASSSGADDEDGDVRRIDHHRVSTMLYKVVLGDRILVPVPVPEWADQTTIRLDLVCAGIGDDDREWPSPAVLEWRPSAPLW